jgi:hypothetical protein
MLGQRSTTVSALNVRILLSLVSAGRLHCKTAAPAMSLLGHSRLMQSAPVPPNVRYASDSDRSRHQTELSRWARSGLREQLVEYRGLYSGHPKGGVP